MRRLLWLIVLVTASLPLQAAEIRVAVASNFKAVLQTLAPAFREATGHTLILSAGSTGLLFAQISQGAPYDVFVAADRERPQRLIEAGVALGPKPMVYAKGRLVLVFRDGLPKSDPPSLTAIATLSIANPRTAPYGRAAEQALTRLDPPKSLRIAKAGNIAGVAAALRSGAVDAGFTALPLVTPDDRARAWVVPADWHSPIEQTAVILKRARDPDAAKAFRDWLIAPETGAKIRTMGYDVD